MNSVNIIFPNQLFKHSDLLDNTYPVFLVEEYLFFNHYQFHKQKLAFHRASMQFYKSYLQNLGKTVHYISATDSNSDIRRLLEKLIGEGIQEVHFINPVDNWLEKRISNATKDIQCVVYESPYFINQSDEYSEFFKTTKKKFFQTSFYIEQRKKLGILLEKMLRQ